MSLMYVTPQEILDFWFSKEVKRHWFEHSEFLDTKVRVMYERIFRDAVNCELSDWRDTIQGRLAEIIILDQFSRLIFRGRPHAYTQDRMALLLAQEAVRYRTFPFLEAKQRQFILMPFLHSENRNIHTVARGRYPHRNAILNRQSTPEELAFLKANPSGFELDDEDDDDE